MKTITDLMRLITKEIEMNEGKLLQYTFDIDFSRQTISMGEYANITSWDTGEPVTRREHEKRIINFESFNTPEKLQLIYWTIFCNGRSAMEKTCTEL